MSACSDRSLAKFQYQSMEGIATALGTIGTVLGWGKVIPHPAAQAAAKVGWVAGGGAGVAAWAAKKYRDKYDELEGACWQQQGQDPHQPTSPKPTGGGGGGGYGGGATSGGYAPQISWVWVPGSVTDDGNGGVIVTAGKWLPTWSPIVLDLNNDGFDFRAAADSISADPNADGVPSVMSWVGPTDGLLVYDYNQNGIGETAEWVLTSFVPGAANDLEALRAFDSNRDGMFSAADSQFHKFRIGIDANQDGRFTAGELHQLSTFHFSGMALTEGYDVVNRGGEEQVPGIRFDYTGNAFRDDAVMMRFASVGFIERQAPVQLFNDGSAIGVTDGETKSFFWSGSGGMYAAADSFTHAGHSGFDHFFGGDGNDILYGDADSNSLYGGGGIDQLLGGGGNDVIFADALDLAYGAVSGGTGYDTLVLDGAVAGTVHAAAFSVDAIIGGDANDVLSGAGTSNVYLMGGGGDDYLYGSDGADQMSGGAGTDHLFGGGGDDLYIFERGFGTEIIEDSGGANDVVTTRRSWFDVTSFTASGNNQVITFNDGSQLVLVNGRLGQGVEAIQFDDFTYTREDINAVIDFTW